MLFYFHTCELKYKYTTDNMVSEFDLINQYFKSTAINRDDVLLGIGDDCALLSPPEGKVLAVSTDTLISGVHFPESTSAQDIGYKSLAVNLSDLAAMGAEPAWVSLAISLPKPDESWLHQFMQGFNQLIDAYNICLIGGDTTQGRLSITINITGFVDAQNALRRSNAKSGDYIYVTGDIGDAGLGLKALLNKLPQEHNLISCINRLNRPVPQIMAGKILSQFAVAAIDISDGLLADLNHICQASHVGAVLNIEQLPVSNSLLKYYKHKPDWLDVITAGDDYELCFTCSKSQSVEIEALMSQHKIKLTRIGKIVENKGVQCMLNGKPVDVDFKGYEHF